MKISSKHLVVFSLFFFGLMVNMNAQSTVTPKVKKTQINQAKRIKQGVKSGELTKAETARLTKQQANIAKTKRRAKADGVVTKRERAKINAKQTQASKAIYKKKHNTRDRN